MSLKKNSIYIIAEIGVNHNGSIKLAKKLIDKAVQSGANAVKFQTFDYKYQLNLKYASKNAVKFTKSLQLSFKDFINLKKYCEIKKIDFISTPFDPISASFLNKINLKLFKIASPSIVDYQLLSKVSKFKKKVLISTGMSKKEEIINALKFFNNKNVTLLYCVSLYPTPFEKIDLNNIKKMKNLFKTNVGFSDHSQGYELALASIGFGATVIEKHFKLSKNQKCPDSIVSLDPNTFAEMVSKIRNIEKSIGKGNLSISIEEKNARRSIRKGLYYNKDLRKNSFLKESDIILRSPSTKFSIENYPKIINKKLLIDVYKNNPIKNKDLKI